VEALFRCKDVEGDICEFGVAQGETSSLIANEIDLYSSKTLHLFDSFEGLPRPSEKDKLKDDIFSLGSMAAYAGTMSNPEKLVRQRLDAISFPMERCVIHKGFIEELIHEGIDFPSKVCFAYLDFDFYEPTILTLDYLHKVTTPGAIIIVDDYDFFSTGIKTAVDEFIHKNNSVNTVYDFHIPNTIYGHFAVLTRSGF